MIDLSLERLDGSPSEYKASACLYNQHLLPNIVRLSFSKSEGLGVQSGDFHILNLQGLRNDSRMRVSVNGLVSIEMDPESDRYIIQFHDGPPRVIVMVAKAALDEVVDQLTRSSVLA